MIAVVFALNLVAVLGVAVCFVAVIVVVSDAAVLFSFFRFF